MLGLWQFWLYIAKIKYFFLINLKPFKAQIIFHSINLGTKYAKI